MQCIRLNALLCCISSNVVCHVLVHNIPVFLLLCGFCHKYFRENSQLEESTGSKRERKTKKKYKYWLGNVTQCSHFAVMRKAICHFATVILYLLLLFYVCAMKLCAMCVCVCAFFHHGLNSNRVSAAGPVSLDHILLKDILARHSRNDNVPSTVYGHTTIFISFGLLPIAMATLAAHRHKIDLQSQSTGI